MPLPAGGERARLLAAANSDVLLLRPVKLRADAAVPLVGSPRHRRVQLRAPLPDSTHRGAWGVEVIPSPATSLARHRRLQRCGRAIGW
jgi:hypothetical protein